MRKSGASGPKHTLCRRVGSCIWGSPKCPSVRRPYSAGQHGKGRRSKLSTYGELLIEKQKLRTHYSMSEQQLRYAYQKAKTSKESTAEKLMRSLELRLSSVVYRGGLAPTIFAAKQAVIHRHVLVDGKIVSRNNFHVRVGQVVSISAERSPAIAELAKKTNCVIPPYLEADRENVKVTLARLPLLDEIPAGVQVMRVVEFYAR